MKRVKEGSNRAERIDKEGKRDDQVLRREQTNRRRHVVLLENGGVLKKGEKHSSVRRGFHEASLLSQFYTL